jgi:alpha-ribazole phosphatase
MPDLKKPMRLFLVRHGEVIRRGQGKFLGFTDLGLSACGRRQVQTLAEYLENIPLDQAWSSNLMRTRTTAEIICQNRGITPVSVPAFREMNMGKWDGKSWGEIKKKNPKVNPRAFSNLKEFFFPGGETWPQFRVRVIKGMEVLRREGQGKNILLAAHAGVNRIFLAQALGLDYRYMFRINQDYACLNIIEYYKTGCRVVLVNGICYKRFKV